MSIKFISIYGSYNQLDVALFENSKCIDSLMMTEGQASSNLIPLLDKLLKTYKLTINDLSFIAVGKGPGAFTSLRVIIATVNGIAFEGLIPLIGINDLQALEVQTLQVATFKTDLLVSLLNAYSNDVYFRISKIEKGSKISETIQGCQKINILLDDLQKRFKSKTISFCGQGSQLYKQIIQEKIPTAIILKDKQFPTAKTIGLMAYQCWLKKGNIENEITPLYLKTQYFATKK